MTEFDGQPRSTCAEAQAPDAAVQLARGLGLGSGQGPFAHVLLFADPRADLTSLAQSPAFGAAAYGTKVTGCTTAGEITAAGYAEGRISAFALPASHFETREITLPDLNQPIDARDLVFRVGHARQALARARPDWLHEAAILLVDGLSGREDELAAALAGALGPVPLFGGSAGDGGAFERTAVFAGGQVFEHGAALVLIRTICPLKVFSLDNLEPTAQRMVVTEAEPARRAVLRINDEPAAAEYARLLHLHPSDLTPAIFAANPVLVRAGGRHHARAIRRITAAGEIEFFSAIDAGLILTLARPRPIAAHLRERLASLAQEGMGQPRAPAAILACDCFFRRVEALAGQASAEVSATLRAHRVTGFSTYGEQIGAMHVNQTMTGLAIFAPLGTPEAL